MPPGWGQFEPEYDQPPYDGIPRAYLIASSPRSGSNLLCHHLLATGQLGSPMEYFNPAQVEVWQRRLGTTTHADMLRALFAFRTSPNGWFGLKLHWSQSAVLMQDPAVAALLDIRRVIRIHRPGTLAQAISLVIARQTMQWISFMGAQCEPEYDYEQIAAAQAEIVAENAGWDAYLRAAGITPLVVKYADLVKSPQQTLAPVVKAFGITPPTSPTFERLPQRQATAVNSQWKRRFLNGQAR